jgi:two-component system, chemotaxis family, chemotaxis protein CheY
MKKVLIIDDTAFMRLTLKTALENNGFEVVGEAENGAQGVKKYKELMPDIVTMDITMPEVTGIEALCQIREFDPKAKVVMLSAMGQESMIKEAVMKGAISFIVKPCKEEHMIYTLKKVLAMK